MSLSESSKALPVAIYLLLDDDGTPRYVGKSINPGSRFNGHIKKGGKDWAKVYFILEWTTHTKYRSRERDWIKIFRKLGFQLDNGNDGGGGLVTLRDEYRQHLREINLGKKYPPEVNAKKGRKGRTFSDETKIKLRSANLGRPVTDEAKEKIRQAVKAQWERQHAKGYSLSKEHKQKISQSVKRSWEDPVQRERHIKSQVGKPLSLEHRENLKLAWVRRRARESKEQ